GAPAVGVVEGAPGGRARGGRGARRGGRGLAGPGGVLFVGEGGGRGREGTRARGSARRFGVDRPEAESGGAPRREQAGADAQGLDERTPRERHRILLAPHRRPHFPAPPFPAPEAPLARPRPRPPVTP